MTKINSPVKIIPRKIAECQFEVIAGFALIMMVTLAGCGGFLGPDSPERTSTHSQTPVTPTNTSTPTASATPSPTPIDTETPEFSAAYKQRFFASNYTTSLEENRVRVANTTVDAENETLHITYEMKDPGSDLYTGRERENISLLYAATAEVYLNRGFGQTWVPKRVNVTAVTPEGELYETAYTTFERAKKMIDGEISAKRYLLEYYNTIEPGPANPDYEGGS